MQTFTQRRDAVRKLDERGAIAPFMMGAERLVNDFPKRALAWLELGIAYSYVARYADAARAFDKSIRLCKPKYLDHPFAWKGQMFRYQGKLGLAEKYYRRAIDVSPKNPDWWAFLGAVLASQGRLEEAKDAWRRQIKIGTGATDEGHCNLGLIYRSEKKFKLALRHAEKALQIDPDYSVARALREDLLEAIGGVS